jgi:hypothetical protein
MTTKVVCDGCGADLTVDNQVAVEGRRANGMGGDELPAGDFHWCRRCARSAFAHLRFVRNLTDLGKRMQQLVDSRVRP